MGIKKEGGKMSDPNVDIADIKAEAEKSTERKILIGFLTTVGFVIAGICFIVRSCNSVPPAPPEPPQPDLSIECLKLPNGVYHPGTWDANARFIPPYCSRESNPTLAPK